MSHDYLSERRTYTPKKLDDTPGEFFTRFADDLNGRTLNLTPRPVRTGSETRVELVCEVGRAGPGVSVPRESAGGQGAEGTTQNWRDYPRWLDVKGEVVIPSEPEEDLLTKLSSFISLPQGSKIESVCVEFVPDASNITFYPVNVSDTPYLTFEQDPVTSSRREKESTIRYAVNSVRAGGCNWPVPTRIEGRAFVYSHFTLPDEAKTLLAHSDIDATGDVSLEWVNESVSLTLTCSL